MERKEGHRLRVARPLYTATALHSIHFAEIIDDFGIATLHSGEGPESLISLVIQGVEGSEGFREGNRPPITDIAAKRLRSRSGATSYSLCPSQRSRASI